jgi:hypothetical protein
MAAKAHRIFEHGDLEALAPGLWSVRGSLPFPLKRNMTVHRLADGTLLLHSVVAMNDEGMAKLDALGRPSLLVVPHGGHRMDARFYKTRYPNVRVVCPAAARAKVEEVIPVDATCEEALPALGIRLHPMPGYKTGELTYEVDVPGGKALIMSEAVANRDHPPGFGGKLMAAVAGGIKGRLGVPRIVKVMLIKDKPAARAALSKLADVADVKVLVPVHGRPLLDGCADALREAAASL